MKQLWRYIKLAYVAHKGAQRVQRKLAKQGIYVDVKVRTKTGEKA